MKSGGPVNAAYLTLQWLMKNRISPEDVRIEIHCKDARTQCRLEAAIQQEQGPSYRVLMGGTLPAFTHQICGIHLTLTNPQRWDVRERVL